MNQTNIYAQKPATQALEDLESLPVAQLKELYVGGPEREFNQGSGDLSKTLLNAQKVTDKAVFCRDKHVATVSDKYVLVQHKDAFKPIVEGLQAAGRSDFTFTTWASNRKAFFAVIVGESIDSVGYGFRATNSIDSSSSINYGMSAELKHLHQTEVEIVERERVLVWTYRQTCSNGAVMMVPLKTERYLDTITRNQFNTLMSQVKSLRIRHSGDAANRIQEVALITEAFLLMGKPIDRMIQDAMGVQYDDDMADKLITKYIGQKMFKRIWESYKRENKATLWSLFNAITFEASHGDLGDGSREVLLRKASKLLTDELVEYADTLPANPISR